MLLAELINKKLQGKQAKKHKHEKRSNLIKVLDQNLEQKQVEKPNSLDIVHSILQEPRKNKLNPLDIINHTRGDQWDKISLKEMLASKNKVLYQGKSKYQDIQVLEAKDIRMYLDNQLQFSALDERIYHEAFVHIPMALTKSRDRILILGGGDALALREILKYSDVKSVDLVDIDKEILNIARNVPEVAALNERALFDKRVNTYTKDARDFLQSLKKTYDLIFIDLPDPENATCAKLYTKEMFQMLNNFLTKDGIIVCQANSPDDTPTVFWSIGLTMEQSGYHTEGYHIIVPSFGDWGFHIGAKQPLPTQLKKVPVPTQTLPTNLASLFHFQSEILSYKRKAIVNSLRNLQLHELFKQETI
jgi:spermidine synthase